MEPTATIENTGNNALRIVIIVVFVFLVLGIGGYLFYMYTTSSSQMTNEQTATQNQNGFNTSPAVDEETGADTTGTNGQNQQAQINQDNQASPEPTEIPPFDPAEPWLKIQTEDGSEAIQVGQEAQIIVSGFSDGTNIDGYDVLLSYDADELEVVEVESLIPSFNIQQFIRGSFVSVTGYKRPDVDEVTAFDETPLLQYTVVAKEAGETELSILPAKGPETSKFVDPEVNQIYPQPETVTLQIQ